MNWNLQINLRGICLNCSEHSIQRELLLVSVVVQLLKEKSGQAYLCCVFGMNIALRNERDWDAKNETKLSGENDLTFFIIL